MPRVSLPAPCKTVIIFYAAHRISTEEAGVAKTNETIDDVLPEIPEGKGGKLIVKEEITVGHVSWSASMSTLLLVPG